MENVLKKNKRPSLISVALTNNFSWRQRLTIKLSESVADERRCVQVNKELETCQKYISPQQTPCMHMIRVVLLSLVGSQAISNATVWFSSLRLKSAQNRAQQGKQMTHPLDSAPLHDRNACTPREPMKRKGKKKVEGDHPLSLYQKAFLVIKAWSLY